MHSVETSATCLAPQPRSAKKRRNSRCGFTRIEVLVGRGWFTHVALAVLLSLTAAAHSQQKKDNQSNQPQKEPSKLHIDSGELLSANGLPIHVTKFDAIIGGDQKPEPRDGGKKPVVTIRNGIAFLTRDAITKLLNSHLNGGSVKDLSVVTGANSVTLKGKVHKAVDVPFEIDGQVQATPEGLIKLQVSQEKAAHLPQGITKALGFDDLSKMIGSNAGKGIQASKDSVTFDPDLMWGLPIHGRVVRAATSNKGLALTFGPDAAAGSKGK